MLIKRNATGFHRVSASLVIAGMLGLASAAFAAEQTAKPPAVNEQPSGRVATVNGKEILVADLMRSVQAALRQKYYHGAVPPEQIKKLSEETLESMIQRQLLIAEAKRRKIEADGAAIEKTLKGYDDRYANSEQWKKGREAMLARIRQELTEQDLVKRIESAVRDVPAADDKAAKAFYDANPGLFTEPMQFHVSVILLKVEPSATKAVRDAARAEARSIHARIGKGADFAELAKVHSAHESAAKGGDMGYLHRGMLPDALDKILLDLAPGAVSPPTDVLDGVSILKLNGRKDANLRTFADVRERAGGLEQRGRSDMAWETFSKDLRSKADVQVNQSVLNSLLGTPSDPKVTNPAPAAKPPASESTWQTPPPSGTGKGAG